MIEINYRNSKLQVTEETFLNLSVYARCGCCKQWIGYHTFCLQIVFEYNDRNTWIVNDDISSWTWFKKIIIADEIFCICRNRIGFKLEGNRTEVIKSAIELKLFI